jgi:hypothetical protein
MIELFLPKISLTSRNFQSRTGSTCSFLGRKPVFGTMVQQPGEARRHGSGLAASGSPQEIEMGLDLVVGVGDPVMDILVHTSIEDLEDLGLEPGGCLPVSSSDATALLSALENGTQQVR